jgi:hypothetical protein
VCVCLGSHVGVFFEVFYFYVHVSGFLLGCLLLVCVWDNFFGVLAWLFCLCFGGCFCFGLCLWLCFLCFGVCFYVVWRVLVCWLACALDVVECGCSGVS